MKWVPILIFLLMIAPAFAWDDPPSNGQSYCGIPLGPEGRDDSHRDGKEPAAPRLPPGREPAPPLAMADAAIMGT